MFSRFLPHCIAPRGGRSGPRLVGTLAVAALGAASCTSGNAASGDPPGRGSDGAQGPGARPPAAVALAPAVRRTLSRSVTLSAPVEPIRRVGVNAQMTGTVLRVRVQEGDRVRPGDLMAELDTREVEAQLERARATLNNAEAAFRRATEMHDRAIVTDAEFEQAKATFGAARSDVALWETRLGFGRITAPAAGMVTRKLVEAGSAVTPNQQMFELADESLFVVRVQASELDVVQLRVDAPVMVVLDAYPDVPVPGRIRRVFPSADPQSRLVPVEVALGAPPAGVTVRPGFLARVRLDLDHLPDAIAVPVTAIGTSADGAYVMMVAGDTLVRRAVEPGLSVEGWTEIRSGIREGDSVVVSSLANLRPGTRVRVMRAEDAAPPGDTGRSR